MALKKGGKSKFLPGDLNDLLNGSEFLKTSPTKKKIQKRAKNINDDDLIEEEALTNLIGLCQTNAKKKKVEDNLEPCKESRQKILDVMNHQQEARRQKCGHLLNNLFEVMSQLEADCTTMKDNEKKLEHLTGAVVKCMQQASTAHKQKLKTLKDIYSSFKKQVEGLITKGAMKPDDRPVWFDIYRAFPPAVEPMFAKPKPEIEPIRQILYPEDAIRAKFHSHGHGLNAINILSENETPTRKLVQHYEKLKAEGVQENDLIEKSVEAVGVDRQFDVSQAKEVPKNPESVAVEINIKNIFKQQ